MSADGAADADETAAMRAKAQRLIVSQRFDEALEQLSLLLDRDSQDTDALYMRAVCQRYSRQFDAALATIKSLLQLAPEHGRAHQEEGHTYRDSGNPTSALRAYARACQYNPALEASWRGQFNILKAAGNDAQAAVVRQRLDHLRGLSQPLVAVIDLVAEGKLLKAEKLCRQYLQKIPDDVEGMRLLADIGLRLGALDDAEFLLGAALKLAPDNTAARIDYVQVLRKRQKFGKALQEAKKLLDAAPQNPQFQSICAVESMQSGDYDSALELFGRVLEQLPGDSTTLTSAGHAHKTCGRYDDAVEAYHEAIASNAEYGEAWYSLANLKVYTFNEKEIATLQALERDANLSFRDRVFVNFALGKAFEDQAIFKTSFDYYRHGNRLKKSQSRYDAETMSADLVAQREVCSAALFSERDGCGHSAPDPIFVVGLPRAGSTLLEQILSSHSAVDGTLELPNILSLSQRLRRAAGDIGYPQNLSRLSADELNDFGGEYIEDTRIHRRSAPRFVDKMPNNFRHIGLIHLILPNAKIIDARREPMACCFSGYKQLFAEGQEFSYDLGDIGRYYRDYTQLMDHWDRVLPGRVLRVQYEDVVADLESQVRRILEYCELPFESGCVEYHRTERSVRTPSSEQVRRPIFSSGLDYWRNYDPWLQPLREALGPLVARNSSATQ